MFFGKYQHVACDCVLNSRCLLKYILNMCTLWFVDRYLSGSRLFDTSGHIKVTILIGNKDEGDRQ